MPRSPEKRALAPLYALPAFALFVGSIVISQNIEHQNASEKFVSKHAAITKPIPISHTPTTSIHKPAKPLTIEVPPASPPSPAQQAAAEVTPEDFSAWSKVNVCEEGGNWYVRGSIYSGGLGISNVNWIKYGGEYFAASAADATPDEQIVIAMRIQADPPDQTGCNGSW